jgi:hypothetical protein
MSMTAGSKRSVKSNRTDRVLTCLEAPPQSPVILEAVPADPSALLVLDRPQYTHIEALISNKNRMRFGLQEAQSSSTHQHRGDSRSALT